MLRENSKKKKNKEEDQETLLFDVSTTEETREQVLHVLEKLPDEILNFCSKKVAFCDGSKEEKEENITLAVCLRKKDIDRDYIIYLDSSFKYSTDEWKHFIICHEIGHAYLGHNKETDDKKAEFEANEFAAKYGFAEPKTKNTTWTLVKEWWAESPWTGKFYLFLIMAVFFLMLVAQSSDRWEPFSVVTDIFLGLVVVILALTAKSASWLLRIFTLILIILLALVFLEFFNVISLI